MDLNTEPQSEQTRTVSLLKSSYFRLFAGAVAALILLFWLLSGAPELPNFAAIDDVQKMKREFAAYLRPIIEAENQKVEYQRQELVAILTELDSQSEPNLWQSWQLRSLASEYGVEWTDGSFQDAIRQLQLRIDGIPVNLALAQAAKESGWGRSRFAVEGNNLFGLWCYEPGCGMVPKHRPKGATHEVASFASVPASVAYYIHNINTHDGYEDLRRRRSKMRQQQQPLDPLKLAEGLLFYSERRGAYVEEVRAMVRQFQRFQREDSDQ